MNYFEESKKHRKLLWDYLGIHKDGKIIKSVDKDFKPEEHFELLRLIYHKIRNTPREGHIIKIIKELYADKCRVTIQEWFDTSKPEGHYEVVKVEDKNEHRAVYNACVEFIIKTS